MIHGSSKGESSADKYRGSFGSDNELLQAPKGRYSDGSSGDELNLN
jgi:hypothetical protein